MDNFAVKMLCVDIAILRRVKCSSISASPGYRLDDWD
jgi:hypothetical protein